ncbi:hypothetical protein KA005_32000 [bacterium]|nr:hypothetical protein [bacterium]
MKCDIRLGLAALFIGFLLGVVSFKTEIQGYQNAIEQCEASLPRDQHCEITARVSDE